MNPILRRRHIFIFLSIAVLLPIVFIAGILLKPNIPSRAGFSPAVTKRLDSFVNSLYQNKLVTPKNIFRIQILADKRINAVIILEPQKAYRQPDILVYLDHNFHTSETFIVSLSKKLLIGELNGKSKVAFFVPKSVLRSNSHVVFYSLAYKKVVDSFKWDGVRL